MKKYKNAKYTINNFERKGKVKEMLILQLLFNKVNDALKTKLNKFKPERFEKKFNSENVGSYMNSFQKCFYYFSFESTLFGVLVPEAKR